MSVETVNGHVLFPHEANYGEAPRIERWWETEVADSEFGQESRFGLRAVPRKVLQWTVTAKDLQEQSQLADRILTAMRSSLACAPHWGRGSELVNRVTAATVTIETSLWPWAADDYLIFIDEDGDYEVAQILTAVGTTITLTQSVSSPHAGVYIWPLIFGRFSIDGYSLLTSRQGQATITIAELTSPESETVGTASPEIDGIGGWIIGDTFIVE